MIPNDNKLWAPWRMEYIKREIANESESCFLCDKPNSEDSEKNLILLKGKLTFVVMNLYPYNNSHLMICPYRHISDFTALSKEERSESQEVISGCIKILTKHMKPEGFNVGLNIGKAGGAGIEEHLHWHLVPRWIGDTNFMPVLGNTKVIMEGLTDSYRKLQPDFADFEKSIL